VTEPARPRRPLPASLAAIILLVLAAVQVVVASLFVIAQAELTASISATSPSATPGELDDRVFAAMASGIVVHAILTVVYIAAASALRTKANVVRLFATGLAVVATFTDGLILGQLPGWLPRETTLIFSVLAISTALRLLVMVLLWVPGAARDWYSTKPAQVRS
jgi:hypothetical protein